MFKAIGIDGCRSGWVVAEVELSSCINIEVFPSLNAVWEQNKTNCQVCLIDMPIGFVDQGPDGRECDRLARRLLSPRRHSSIFTPPCRTALYAPMEEVSEVNFKYTGKRLSRQTINIMPKMKAVDSWIRQLPASEQVKIKESHPEVVFCCLNGGRPLVYNKKKLAGVAERMDILRKYLPGVDDYLEEAKKNIPRKIAQVDDLIDALVLALAADMSLQRPQVAGHIPHIPPKDKYGLPMQIFFVKNV